MFMYTYTKFFSFIIGAFVLSFIGLELYGSTTETGITAMVVHESAKSSLGTPNLMFLFLGMVAGTLISLGLVYLYYVESNRY